MNEKRQTISDDVTLAGPGAGRRAELAPGARLGRYEIVRLLGRGGMGQVYLARHGLQKTLHALKILPAEFSGRPGFVERFRTELQTMARLQHPNIVHVTHSDEENGRYYLVMDFVAADGTGEPYDLEEALAVEGRLAPETVRRLMLGLCDGLCHAHGHGVVHRDLKPANVLLTSKDLSAADARICDFGLARVVGEEQVRTLVAQSMQRSLSLGEKSTFVEKRREERSSTGSVLGTYGYMSPEQEEGKPADWRSDLYALGVMMYRMITGQRLRGMAKPASQVVEGLDPAWDAVIGRCLENDPEARWQAAGELKAALRRIGEGSQKSGVRSQKKRALGLAAALLVLGYGIYRAYGTYSDRRAEERAQAERAAALEEVTHPTAGNVLGMLFVEVEPGSFRMGSEDGWFDEKPARAVRLTRLFWMGKHEVTQREYQQLTGSNPSHFKGDNLPVETVSWDDAVKFCEELTRRERAAGRMPAGYEYRLPTEAEWEYAARGGAKSRGYAYAGGNDLDAVAWYGDNSGSATHPVGQKEANELGLFDMSGNVWEWCQDWYQGSYTGLGTDDPSGPSSGSNRVGRGGGWGVDTSYCRIASRGNGTPSFTGYNLGLRVCLAPPVQ